MTAGGGSHPQRRPLGTVSLEKIALAHGGGGKAMRDLIDDVFVRAFDNALLAPLGDQAQIPLAALSGHGDRLAVTTDSYVVDPLFFPGGDIGKLAVCGTVNDLAVGGARTLYLTCGVIIEEGFPVEMLRRVANSMAQSARAAGVSIITGDTKVVPRGACDKLFINTAGIGVIGRGIDLGADKVRIGDAVLVSGLIGDHGAAILGARGDLALASPIESDCAPLNGMIADLLATCPSVRFMRDATRGGIATVLNEVVVGSDIGIAIEERAIPMREEVRGFCEILGLDPLYLANEGKIVCILPDAEVAVALATLSRHRSGELAAVVGHVTADRPGRVIMRSVLGGHRIVDMLSGEQLPRIC